MYHFATYQFHPELLSRKLIALTGNRWDRVYLAHLPRTKTASDWQTTRLAGAASLPQRCSAYPNKSWMIVSGDLPQPGVLSGDLSFDWSNHNPIEHLNRFVGSIAAAFDWAVVPWGSFMTDEAFLFVSRDKSMVERFVREAPDSIVIPFYDGEVRGVVRQEMVLRIAGGRIDSSLLEQAFMVEVDEISGRGGQLWDLCAAEAGGLFLATARPDREIEYRDGPGEELTPSLLAETGDVHVVQQLVTTTMMNEGEFWLYRVSSRDALCRIAKIFHPVNGFAGYAAPLSIGEPAATEMLRELVLRDDQGAFVRINRALATTPWVYTAGDCHMDVTYERFASRNHDLLKAFISDTAARRFELISIF